MGGTQPRSETANESPGARRVDMSKSTRIAAFAGGIIIAIIAVAGLSSCGTSHIESAGYPTGEGKFGP